MLDKVYPYMKFRYFIFFFSLVAGWPCVFYLMGWLPHYVINYIMLFVIAGFYLLNKNTYRIPRPIALLLMIQVATWCIYSAIHGIDSSYFTRIVLLGITYFILEMQLMKPDRKEFIKTYNFWLVFQVVAGAIGFLLVLAGVLQPIFEFREMDMRPGYFFGFFTTNTYLDGFIRNAGFFDEPGALAFWGIYALLINKLFIDNKKVELLLIFGLISTLSLAYFIQLTLYLWFFYKGQRKRMISYLLVFIILLKIVASFNERLDKAIFGRMQYDTETGKLAGDNRSELTVVCWDIFKTAPVLGQGARHFIEISQQRREFVGANPLTTLASDGIVGQVVVLLPFFFLFKLRKQDPQYGWAFWILIVGFLQRPYDCTQLLYPLMSFSIVLQAYLQTKNYGLATRG